MKVAVLGASGRAGSEITKELAARGHTVTAIARKPEAIPTATGVTPVAGDASDAAALADLIKGSDAVISALHFDVPAATILGALKTAGVPRLLVTGGAASLEVAPGVLLFDTPQFPAEWKPIAKGGITSSDVAAHGLEIRHAIVRGPMLPGIVSLWEPVDGPAKGIPYIVFAGNVGDDQSLADVTRKLSSTF